MAEQPGISIREFARRDKCDERLVRRAIQNGYLAALPTGRLDPALVGSAWRERNRRAAEAAGLPEGDLPPLADSRRRLEHIKAEMDQVELDLAIGKVASTAPRIADLGQRLATCRSRFLAMPAEQAVAISRLRSAAPIEVLLHRLFEATLDELGHPALTVGGGP